MSRRPPERVIEGVVQIHGHFAFLLSERPGERDVYLRGPSLRLAMNGDRVQARITGSQGARVVGEIVRVVTRARTTAVGVLRRAGKFWALVPEKGTEADALQVLGADKDARLVEGHLASMEITRWPTEERPAGGTVTAVLGAPEEPLARVSAILAERGIAREFPADVLAQAATMPRDPAPEEWAGRRELFDLPVFTIDGADAKDFDDAVSLEELGGGRLRLGVHIADVAQYVKRDSPLDKEAFRRGTSTYLPGQVIPMLPPNLSDHLCSLRPDVPRLTLTCWLDMDAHGTVHGAKVEQTVIRSCRRFTYEEVQDLLDGKDVPRVPPAAKASILKMGPFAKALTAARFKRGALDLNSTEFQVKVDAKGEPIEVVKRPRLDSHRLIEEFMLSANEAVARHLARERVPFLRRLHDVPDPSRLEELQEEMGKLGIRAKTSLVAHPVEGLQSLLEAAKGHPFEETANIQVVRSLKLAQYSPKPGGHFGLASKEYCHFTSPIRRYPDLFVHRALKGLLTGKPRAHADGLNLESVAARCCERERAAQEAERKAVDSARARLLGRRVGAEFAGVVVNMTDSGLFIALPESGAVGLLRGGSAPLGTKLTVRLLSADPASGRLEFEDARKGLPGQVRVSPRRPGPRRPRP